jgi:hypothetical protein
MRGCVLVITNISKKEVEAMENIGSYRFVGVDTHKDQHTAAVIDCFNRSLGIVDVPNNPNCFDDFIKQVKVYTNSNQLAFGLEDTGGLGRSLACFLTGSGMLGSEVNPTLTERRRKTRPHPEKSDPQDALVVYFINSVTYIHKQMRFQIFHHHPKLGTLRFLNLGVLSGNVDQ